MEQERIDIDSKTNKPVKTYVYIDDFNAVEPIRLCEAPTHHTTRKTCINVHAKKSERLFDRISCLAGEIGMQVNGTKTQMLCINSFTHNTVTSMIKHGDLTINSTDSIKLLGFTFDTRPNANKHVEIVIEKFYARLWTLRFFKKEWHVGQEPLRNL